MTTLVMKFGGSSVGTTTALTQVLSIVLHEHEQWDRLILIVSALDGVTDALIEAAHLAQLGNQRGYRRIIANLRTRHLALIEELPLGTTERTALQADIDRLLFDLLDIYQIMAQTPADSVVPDKVDSTTGVGERLAARIISALLRQNDLRSVAIDATDLIVTDEAFGNATPNIDMTRELVLNNLLPMLDRKIIPVVTGFIGATPKGKPTTMGRGGSDLTASVLGVCSNADEVWIWTAVDGMMTADPREVIGAKVIPVLSYQEVAELAYFGARILHARMVTPLAQERIPLRIKNVYKPQQHGTLVHHSNQSRTRTLKAVTSIAGLGLMADRSGSLSPISLLVDQTLFTATHTHADVMISSQSSTKSFVCFLIPTSAGPDAVHGARQLLLENLAENPETESWTVHPVSIITTISDRLDEWPELTAEVLQTLGKTRILGIAQGPSHCTLSIVVEPQDAEEALMVIHQLILNSA
jgi:bifunctional aspartokinase / homoserine dehydrogenase 1